MQVHRNAREIVGIINFPYPWRVPFIVWSNIINIIVKELICKTDAPAVAFGNNKFKIGLANMHIPIVQGSPINIDMSNENDALFVISLLFFFAFAAEIAGTSAVAKATFIDNGSVISVSTFPPNIPYWLIAISSDINVFKLLTTVKESIFLLIEDIIAVNAIGIETINILFIIVLTLSYL